MRFFSIALFLIFLTGCQTAPQINYFQHYEYCMNQYQDMQSIAQCGKQSRNNYIRQVGHNHASSDGDQFVLYVDTLAEQVSEKRRANSEAKLQLINTIRQIKMNYMSAAAAIYGAQQQQSDSLINDGMDMLSGRRGVDGSIRSAPSAPIINRQVCTSIVISRNPYMTKEVCR
jgi:hypothetical protein